MWFVRLSGLWTDGFALCYRESRWCEGLNWAVRIGGEGRNAFCCGSISSCQPAWSDCEIGAWDCWILRKDKWVISCAVEIMKPGHLWLCPVCFAISLPPVATPPALCTYRASGFVSCFAFFNLPSSLIRYMHARARLECAHDDRPVKIFLPSLCKSTERSHLCCLNPDFKANDKPLYL